MPDCLRSALADHYAIEREIGSGGMATVYLAHDLKHDRMVALKVMRPELSAILGGERFLREIRIAAKLNHPHILALHDSGESDGFLYYVMPHVEGDSLRAKIDRETQLSIDEAVSLTRQVASALDCAHQQGVIHRDIKPENILLHRGEAVVADFGIALAVTAAGGERLTETGLSLGTPEYMSPEQATGDHELDARTDIYSLGAVLYEMVTGEPPQTGATAQAVIAKLLSQPPVQPRLVRNSVPEPMDRAIMKALAKVPADRFGSAAEFAAALTAEAVGEADGKSIAVLPFANLSPDPEMEYFSDGMTEEIINALAQLEDLRVAARTSSFWFKGKSPQIAEVGEKLKVATVLEGSVRRAGNKLRITAQLVKVADGYHLWSERYDRDMNDIFVIQDEIARTIADRMKVALGKRVGGPLVTPPTEDLEAYDLYLKGRFLLNQLGENLWQGLECFQKALSCDPEYARAHAGVADAYSFLGATGLLPPNEAMPQARAAAIRALELDGTLAEAHVSVGLVSFSHDWEWSNAELHFLRAIELNPDLAEAHSWYGFFLFLIRGRSEEAIAELRRGVELDPLAETGNVWLGEVLTHLRRFPDAIDHLRTVVELAPTSWFAHQILAMAYSLDSKYSEALAEAQTAISLTSRHPWSLAILAATYAASGDTAQASAIHDELIARSRVEYVTPYLLAILSGVLGRKDEAFEWLDRAYDERDPILHSVARHAYLAPLRDDPRLDALVKKMGLE